MHSLSLSYLAAVGLSACASVRPQVDGFPSTMTCEPSASDRVVFLAKAIGNVTDPQANDPSFSDSLRAETTEATRALLRGETKTAVSALRSVENRAPKYALAHRVLGLAYARMTNRAEARFADCDTASIAEYNAYFRVSPPTPDALLAKAMADGKAAACTDKGEAVVLAQYVKTGLLGDNEAATMAEALAPSDAGAMSKVHSLIDTGDKPVTRHLLYAALAHAIAGIGDERAFTCALESVGAATYVIGEVLPTDPVRQHLVDDATLDLDVLNRSDLFRYLAISGLETLVIAAPEYPAPLRTLVIAYDEVGRHDEAAARARDFLKAFPTDPHEKEIQAVLARARAH